jgi:hypothetical protein
MPGPDPSVPLDIIPATYLTSMQLVDLSDGDHVSLEFPPQGGHVLFVGARVRNFGKTTATLRVRLRSAVDDHIVAEDSRTIAFAPSSADPTLSIPDLRSYTNVANVAVCPMFGSVNIYDQTYTLEVIVTDVSGATGSVRRSVIPTCMQPGPRDLSYCKCDCAANYVVGQCAGI